MHHSKINNNMESSGLFKKIKNRVGKFMYFMGGKRMSDVVGEQQNLLMREYLFSTKKLQLSFRRRSPIDVCKLGLPNLHITKVYTEEQQSSVSDSIICTGLAYGEEVFVKMSFEPRDRKKDNSLETEALIYEKVIPRLAMCTPNLIPFLSSGVCSESFGVSLEELMRTGDNALYDTLSVLKKRMTNNPLFESYALDKMRMVVTKAAKGIKLERMIHDFAVYELHSEEELEDFMKDILFQLAYTLVVFEKFGLMHHDLHVRNVFVEKLPIPLHYSVDILDRKIVRNVKYFVQIYDFDRSTKVQTIYDDVVLHNTLLDSNFCEQYGECNEFHENVDWFTILQSMFLCSQYFGSKLPILETLVDNDLLTKSLYDGKELVHMGRPCTRPDDVGNRKCVRFPLEESLIISPLEFLRSSYEAASDKCIPAFSLPTRERKVS
jgi:hypothetical protein